jgi:hypothetical protein
MSIPSDADGVKPMPIATFRCDPDTIDPRGPKGK